jgi:hypothetical protein
MSAQALPPTPAALIREAYGFELAELSVDAENVMRREVRTDSPANLDTFRGIDGRIYVRFDR